MGVRIIESEEIIYGPLKIWTDGAVRKKSNEVSGPAAIGLVIKDNKGNIIDYYGEFIGDSRSHRAEYTAIIRGLDRASSYSRDEVEVRTDDGLIVDQLASPPRRRTLDRTLFRLKNQAQFFETFFKKVSYTHIRRLSEAGNIEADRLCNEILNKELKK